MEDSLNALFSLQFICLCLAVAGINEILRRITEFVLDKPQVPASKTSKIWTDLILPLSPLGTGVLITLIFKGLPYPEGWGANRDARVMLGFIAGLLSGLVYRVAASFLRDKLNKYRGGDDAAPPPPPPPPPVCPPPASPSEPDVSFHP